MFKQDYILRMVEELAQAVARILKQAPGEEVESLDAEFDRAEQALGVLRGAESLEARSLVRLLGGDKSVLYAKLLLARCTWLEQRQSQAAAQVLRRRAYDLLRHSRPEQLADLKEELLRQAP